MAAVGEAILSAAIEVLFDRLASREVVNFLRRKRSVDGLLKKLRRTLLVLEAVLDDAEAKHTTNQAVKAWLDELKDAVYDAEDLVDKIAYEALRCKVEQTSTSTISFDAETESNIKDMIDRLEDFVKEKDALGLISRGDIGSKRASTTATAATSRLPTTSLVDEAGVLGRDEQAEEIIDLLLSDHGDASGETGVVIPIVGMGGIGKTTLAQRLYNDPRVDRHFQIKTWVFVSEVFDVLRISKSILEGISKPSCTSTSLNEVQASLKEKLTGVKYLIVLDDMWNDNYEMWEILKRPLMAGAPGSKILATTRHHSVASVLKTTLPDHDLQPLSDADCFSIFAKIAFAQGDSAAPPELKKIGKMIAERCKGLPLAAKTLGGMLRSNLNIQDWNNVLKSEIWDLPEDKNNIFPALRLSYFYLPSHLKQCFAYCSIFPKGFRLEKEVLVLFWMAQSFVQPRGNKTMEQVGEEYIEELVSRSFFQKCDYGVNWFRPNYDRNCFQMHDLIHDLARVISGQFSFYVEDMKQLHDIPEKVRHIFVGPWLNPIAMLPIEDVEKLKALNEIRSLRTFLYRERCYKNALNMIFSSRMVRLPSLPDWIGRCMNMTLSLRVAHLPSLPDRIGRFIHLRFLHLSNSKIKQLPESICDLYNLQTLFLDRCSSLTTLPTNIGKLISLCFLDIHDSRIQQLPDSICDLYNLKTLLLINCSLLTTLPTDFGKLISLHRLEISGCTGLKEMPMQITQLSSLQHLSHFILGKHDGLSMKDLSELPHLQGKLCISNLQNVMSAGDALDAKLKDRELLEEFKYVWEGEANDSRIQREVLENMQPHANLRELKIRGYGGTSFPDWLDNPSFTNMTSLSLRSCKFCFSLPCLGQLPSLKFLDICGMGEIRKVGPELYGDVSLGKPFRCLKTLTFKEMSELEEWVIQGVEEFPRLERLGIYNCPKLKWIQGALSAPNLTEFNIRCCDQLRFLPERMCELLPSLGTLRIWACPEIESFPEGGGPANLTLLDIILCEKLFAHRGEWGIQTLSSLEYLKIMGHEGLEGFPDEGFLPSNLKSLDIKHLSNLKSLNGRGLQHLGCLEELEIWNCPRLEYFPEEGLPSSLSRLYIRECPSLKPFRWPEGCSGGVWSPETEEYLKPPS